MEGILLPQVFYESDADLTLLQTKKIAVIGYGSQGHAHALNLKESGCDVIVGLYPGSRSKAAAEAEGLTVMDTAEAAKAADIIMILTPDETQKEIFERDIKPNLKDGDTVMVAHGFNILYGQIAPPSNVDVSMIAPKSPGHLVRDQYVAGNGVPALVAVHQDASGNALRNALAYSRRPSRTRPRPTTSASRRCSAAVSARWSRPPSRRWSTPATRPSWPTSSACTS
jgi:ketol-acid reductoisomerase